MAARARVPQFGKWEENEDNVPYTLYFENARKGKGGKMINPNDPQENPDMFRQSAPPAPSRNRPQTGEPMGRGAVRPLHTHKQQGSREYNNHSHGSHSRKPTRQSIGSEDSFERSPIHSHHQGKVSGRNGTSPAWDGESSYGSSQGTHGKSRRKPVTRVDESPDRSPAVPRFGEWDENNPQSAERYTHIFNIMREERHTGPSSLSGNKMEPSDHMTQKQNASGNRKGCCFPWLGR